MTRSQRKQFVVACIVEAYQLDLLAAERKANE